MIQKISGIISKGPDMDRALIEKYEGKLPDEMIEIWRNYGEAELLDGYLRVINPEEYQQFIKETYFRGNVSIPVFTTAFGDVVTIEEDIWVGIVRYKNGRFNLVTKDFHRFLSNLLDEYFLDKYLEIPPFTEAVEKLGKPGHDECFGYVPLLGMGGSKKVKNLNIVKTREHLELIVQMVGTIGM